MSVCLLCRFKNERHIMYEFVNHYLLEDIDCLFLIDDNSNDKYYEKNKYWLDKLIKNKKVVFLKSKYEYQEYDYNHYLDKVKLFKWVICVDLDEFMFSVPKNTTLKYLLNNKLSKYDYIKIFWKLFTHKNKFQPKSVIKDNIFTHESNVDESSKSKGIKCIAKTKNLKYIHFHYFEFYNSPNTLKLYNSHNSLIQNNHYRTQSDEYLYGVKEVRGTEISKDRYKNFTAHIDFNYSYKCNLLKKKRKELIKQILKNNQIKPKIYIQSSFYKNILKDKSQIT